MPKENIKFIPESTAFISLIVASGDINGLIRNWANLEKKKNNNKKTHENLLEITGNRKLIE